MLCREGPHVVGSTYKLESLGGAMASVPVGMSYQCQPFVSLRDILHGSVRADLKDLVVIFCNCSRYHFLSRGDRLG